MGSLNSGARVVSRGHSSRVPIDCPNHAIRKTHSHKIEFMVWSNRGRMGYPAFLFSLQSHQRLSNRWALVLPRAGSKRRHFAGSKSRGVRRWEIAEGSQQMADGVPRSDEDIIERRGGVVGTSRSVTGKKERIKSSILTVNRIRENERR